MTTSTYEIEELPAILTVKDLAKVLMVGINTTYRLLRSGEIRSIKVGRQYRIPRASILSYLECKKEG